MPTWRSFMVVAKSPARSCSRITLQDNISLVKFLRKTQCYISREVNKSFCNYVKFPTNDSFRLKRLVKGKNKGQMFNLTAS